MRIEVAEDDSVKLMADNEEEAALLRRVHNRLLSLHGKYSLSFVKANMSTKEGRDFLEFSAGKNIGKPKAPA